MTVVSVIIPTHNRASFVGGAIETALAQTHNDLEVIVVADGSTDGTRSVLERYAENERVRAFNRAENRGIADGRNYALAQARGEYVCVLDDDDRWHPEKVERQVQRFETLDDSYGVVYTGGVIRREGRTIGTYRPSVARQGGLFPDVLVGFDLQPYSGHMIRRTCFDRVGGYDPELGAGEDWDHCIRLAREYRFAGIADRLVERTFHEDNASRDRRRTHGTTATIPRRIENGTGPYGQIWAKYREEIERYPGIERRFRARREVACARVELDHGNRRKALSHALGAMGYSPSTDAVLLGAFACLGTGSFDVARRLRDAWVDRRRGEIQTIDAENRVATAPGSPDPTDRIGRVDPAGRSAIEDRPVELPTRSGPDRLSEANES